jgi:hypothetical protein
MLASASKKLARKNLSNHCGLPSPLYTHLTSFHAGSISNFTVYLVNSQRFNIQIFNSIQHVSHISGTFSVGITVEKCVHRMPPGVFILMRLRLREENILMPLRQLWLPPRSLPYSKANQLFFNDQKVK